MQANQTRHTLPQATVDAAAAPRPAGAGGFAGWRRQWLPLMLALAVLAGMVVPGIRYRRWAWDFTALGRYKFDINRNYNFGKTASEGGILNIYEDQVRDDPPMELKLDYPPLRLATFQAWVAWKQWGHPENRYWKPDYAFNAPLMRYYTALELLAALAAFLLVRYWLRQCAQAEWADLTATIPPSTGLVRATLAFALLWFDPGVVVVAHGWPSPNMWVIPFYLWTALLCLWDWWFAAGLVMGVGAMMQGQQLLVASVFVLWPLFAGKPLRALRWLAGFGLAFMLIASGWMLTRRPDIQLPARQINWPAVQWVAASVGLLGLLGLRTTLRRRIGWPWFVPLAVAAAVALVWPAIRTHDQTTMAIAILAALLLVGLFWQLSWTIKRYLLALTAGACLLLCIQFFNAGTAWWRIGFLYGAERFPNVGGSYTNNLPTILQGIFEWNDIHDIAFDIPKAWMFGWPADDLPVNVRQLLLAVFLVFFIAGAVAIARQWQRRDPNLLAALILPWLMFYTILPQMSPRYAVFVAGVGAICIGRSAGLSLLVLLFSALTVEQTSLCMMGGNHIRNPDFAVNPLFNTQMQDVFRGLNPGISWAEVVAAGVLFYVACMRSRRRPAC